MGKIISEMEHYSDKGKEGLKMFFLYGLQMLRSAMLIQHQDLSDKLTATELEFAGKLSKLIELKSTQIIYDAFNEAIFEIDRNGSVKLILINLSLKLKNSLRPKVVSPTN
jgi:DNA polymerase-3 subunit delta'